MRPECRHRSVGDRVALDVEMVVDGGVGRKETLGRSKRAKPSPPTLTFAGRLVRNLGPVVRSPAGHVAVRQADLAQCRVIGARPVGDDRLRRESLPLETFAQQLQGGPPVASRLHDHF